MAGPHNSNLVNIVALRSIVTRIRGLSIKCTRGGCDEKVSYVEQEILNTLDKCIYDMETRDEVLSKYPQSLHRDQGGREEICWCPVRKHSSQ